MREVAIVIVAFGLIASMARADVEPVTVGATEPRVTSPSDSEPSPEAVAPVGTDAAEVSPATARLIANVTIFVLAIFVGFELITKVPPTLHTPLMSGSNAISGITLVGALLATGTGNMDFAAVLGFFAVIMATVNVVGGFLVTDRMLSMFRRKPKS
jgi:NAD(P) transhydrogenase subunit alpha